MATYKTVTFTDEEWQILRLAFWARERALKELIAKAPSNAYRREQLAELEALAARLGV